MLLGRRIDINDSRFVMASLDHVVHRVTVLRDLVSTLLSSKEVSRHLISVTGNRTSFGIGDAGLPTDIGDVYDCDECVTVSDCERRCRALSTLLPGIVGGLLYGLIGPKPAVSR